MFVLLTAWAGSVGAQQGDQPYVFTTVFVSTPIGCSDDMSKPEIYAVISRVDRELEEQINRIEKSVKRAVGERSMMSVRSRLDYLQDRFDASSDEPLTEEETQELAQLRREKEEHEAAEKKRVRSERREYRNAVKRGEDPNPVTEANNFPDNDWLAYLAFREPLTRTENRVLNKGKELLQSWNELNRRLKVRVNPRLYGPHTLQVLQDDALRVVIWEDDFWQDDLCFRSVLKLDEYDLSSEVVEVRGAGSDAPVFMILSFKPAD